MKFHLLLLPCLLAASCEQNGAVRSRVTDRVIANRVYADEARGVGLPGKQYPVAELIPEMPGFVRSPYTQQPVDLRGKRLKPLMEDPSVKLARRYFALPAGFQPP